MKPYQYEALEADEIRLLQLQAGGAETELHGTLHTYRLSDNDDDADVGSELFVSREGGVTVPNAPPYRALSYTWGSDLSHRYHVRVLQRNGSLSELGIKHNLYDALIRLRQELHADESCLVWADAISINQADIPEKNQQIQKMAMIYNRAESVCVWLGREEDNSSRAIEFVRKLQRLEEFDFLTQDTGTPADWAALHNLMHRPWFSRRWIVQEIALARKAMLYCGPNAVSWPEFSTATALFVARHRDLRHLFQSSKDFHNHPNFLGEVEASGAKSLVNITTNLFRKSEDGAVLERLLSLEALISTLPSFEAGSPHDTIYAVLWLSHDAEPGSRESAAMSMHPVVTTPTSSPEIDPEPSQYPDAYSQYTYRGIARSPGPLSPEPTQNDYNESQQPTAAGVQENFLRPPHRASSAQKPKRSASDLSKVLAESSLNKLMHFQVQPHPITVDYSADVYDVFSQFLVFAMSRSRSLDLICHPWAPEPLSGSPPLPSWIPQLSNAPFEKRKGSNSYARVRADSLVGTPGLGAKNYSASGKTKLYPPMGFIRDRTLIVTGFVLDAIRVKRSTAVDGIIPPEWLELLGYERADPVPEQLWRTLVADRAPGGKQYPPPYFPLACNWMLEQRSRRGKINTTELLTFPKCPSIAAEYLYRVQSVVWDRSLASTEGRRGSKKLLALVPDTAKVGDLICILYGCSVPVVLRRCKKRKADAATSRSRSNMKPESTASSKTYAGGAGPATPQISLSQASSNAPPSDVDSTEQGINEGSFTKPAIPGSPYIKASVRQALHEDPDERPQDVSSLPTSLESSDRYVFIGESYVHGMMAGEGFKRQKDHGHKTRAFHII
ncbi:hypothetical protein BAUCODRAFT_39031 [Baudoinia panamericana UAMH 10762]|uniref:Heterokaryon incompatibility domain-containing protein n=1 Tax=Baudoinia panamericana (strain UAMH 10762) TaxID=717646 RepID=M2M5I3_BAUPA|nr:uncharacterized protein BAUCODRAFT_39031 [Baudoinia panamericana UAMH 10762]EMC91886.1 hypothetical protein BAUCODRAFT_39031 [Baudoinia panamericana UAMH 10762]